MPSTQDSLPSFITKIAQGEIINVNLNTFDKILDYLTNPSSVCKQNFPLTVDSLYDSLTGQNIPCVNDPHLALKKINQWKILLSKEYLVNFFNYLRSVIQEMGSNLDADRMKKLLKVLDHFFQISPTNLNLTVKKVNDINRAYFDLFASICSLPTTIDIRFENQKDPKVYELMSLSIGYFIKLNKLNTDMSEEIKKSRPYQIYLPLKSYLGGLGDLTFNFRHEYHDVGLSAFENNAIQLINSLTNLTIDQLSTLRYTFLNQYHNDAHLLGECKKLFNTTSCDPYEYNSQFNLISRGRTLRNSKLIGPFLKKLMFGSIYDIQSRLTNLSITVDKNNPLGNFLDYFKTFIKEANQKNETISAETIINLSKLIFYSTDPLESTQPKSKIYDSVFSLLLNLLKNPAVNDQFIHVWQAINACGNQMQNLLKTPQPGITSSLSIVANIFHIANDIPAISIIEKQVIANKISELTKTCFKLKSCGSPSALDQFCTTLGSMVRSLSKRNQTPNEETAAQAIEKTAQEIIQNAANNSNVSESRLEGLAWSYLKGLHDKNVKFIERDCEKLFNLTNCMSINPTVEPGIDTALICKTITNATSVHPVTTVTASTTIPTVIPLHLNETIIPVNTTTEASLATTELINVSCLSSNQTTIDISAIENTQFFLASKIATAMGLGALTGFLNGGSQVILHIAEQKNCSSKTQRLLAITLAIANSFSISTLPLIYSIVENLANEEADSLVNSQKLLACIYAFITSVVLQSLNFGINYALPKKTILKNLFNMLPLFAGLWMLANSEESAIESLAILGTHILTSMAASSVSYFSLNRLFSTKNQQGDIEHLNTKIKYNVQANDLEMKPLNSQANSDGLITTVTEENLTPEEIFFKKVEFLTADQYKKLKDYLNNLIESIKILKNQLSNQTHIDRLDQIIHNQPYGLHYDLIDLENFPQKFITEYNKHHDDEKKTQIVKLNFNYFKTLIKTIYDKLLSDNVNNDCLNFILCSIKETKTLKNSITDLIKSIEANLAFIRGITKPLVSIHLPQQLSPKQENLPKKVAGVLSKQETGITHVNNRYSIHSFNNNVARFSSASGNSSDSALSDGYGNTKFNDSKIQEEQSLLNTRLRPL